MRQALEKNKGGKGVRVGKFVVLNRVFRAGLAETFMAAAGGGGGVLGAAGTQGVAGVCEVIFAHEVLPKSVFPENSLTLILVLVGLSPLKYQPPWCTGMTQREGMGREVGGRFRKGNTCTPMEDSSPCMAKPIQYCEVKMSE